MQRYHAILGCVWYIFPFQPLIFSPWALPVLAANDWSIFHYHLWSASAFMLENVGENHMTDHAETPQIPSLPPNLQHKDVFIHTHTSIDTHIKSSSTSEILQKQKISASELCPSPPTNGFQAGLWIFLFKSCSLRRGGDGKGKGHWEKAEGRSC